MLEWMTEMFLESIRANFGIKGTATSFLVRNATDVHFVFPARSLLYHQH